MQLPNWLIIISILVLSVLIRWYALSGNQVFFFYDQARDAALVQEIYQNHDLKIQGPPASGTNETVYHGVFYYYLLATLYWWLETPFWVTFGLAILNSLTVLPLWLLAKSMTKSNLVAALTCGLFAVSYESTQAAIWLSNPNLIPLTFCLFYLGLWQVCYQRNDRYLPLLAVGLGLSHQLLVFTFFLYGPLMIGLWYRWQQTKVPIWKMWSPLTLALNLGLIGILISPMILTQIILWQRQIFTIDRLMGATHQSSSLWLDNWMTVSQLWIKKLQSTFMPGEPLLIAVSAVIVLSIWLKQQRSWWWFGLSWLTAPIWLFLLHPRNAYHALMSIELLIYLAVSWLVVTEIRKIKLRPQVIFNRTQLIVICLIPAMVMYNLLSLKQAKQTQAFLYDVRPAALLSTQLQLIDYVYQQAQGQPFSLSTLTTPYGFNTTWSYLFNWYGRGRYGYQPVWYGPDQAGIAAGNLLLTTNQPLPFHVAIYESPIGIDPWLRDTFATEQGKISSASTQTTFGSLMVELHQP